MTTNHEHLREVAQRNLDTGGNRALYAHIDILSLLGELAALRKENEGLRAALEVEQVDLEFTIQAIVADDPKDEIHLRVRDQKRRVTTALNAARAAIGDSHE